MIKPLKVKFEFFEIDSHYIPWLAAILDFANFGIVGGLQSKNVK
jgi:hypothetical protein